MNFGRIWWGEFGVNLVVVNLVVASHHDDKVNVSNQKHVMNPSLIPPEHALLLTVDGH